MRFVVVFGFCLLLAAVALADGGGFDSLYDSVDTGKEGTWDAEEFETFADALLGVTEEEHADHAHEEEEEHEHEEEHHFEYNSTHIECAPPAEIFEHADANGDAVLNATEAELASTLVMLQVNLHACEEEHEEHSDDCDNDDDTEVWLSMLLSVLIVSLIGAVCVCFFPLAQNRIVMSVLLSFAVGTLLGDSMLHLIPHALGAHGHSDDGHGHEEEKKDEWEIRWIMSTVVISALVFFVLEKLIHRFGGHHHHHGTEGHKGKPTYAQQKDVDGKIMHNSASSTDEEASSATASLTQTNPSSEATASSQWEKQTSSDSSAVYGYDSSSDAYSEAQEQEEASYYSDTITPSESREHLYHTHLCYDVESFGMLACGSDSLHNFIDGLVIGVTYAASFETGLATTIAVLFHEIPQELGDYGVLFKAGFTLKQALFFNTLSACFAFLGGIIGVFVGQSAEDALPYFLAITTGAFLFIALADLMPQLTHNGDFKLTAIEVIGVFLGLVVMFVLSVTEKEEACSL